MKKYCVQIDITFGANVYVEADSEEEAMNIASEKVSNEPMFHARQGWFVGENAVCVNEE